MNIGRMFFYVEKIISNILWLLINIQNFTCSFYESACNLSKQIINLAQSGKKWFFVVNFGSKSQIQSK
ncbi:hypothetical protein DPW02_03635 [Aggregatibacter aphrophilus]|nr:hypothetical protein DPW02_03635 [Aggregatibacter aphrophilus]